MRWLCKAWAGARTGPPSSARPLPVRPLSNGPVAPLQAEHRDKRAGTISGKEASSVARWQTWCCLEACGGQADAALRLRNLDWGGGGLGAGGAEDFQAQLCAR